MLNSIDLKRAAVIAAALLLVAGLLIWNVWLHRQLQDSATTIETLSGQLTDERAEVQRFNGELGLANSIVASRNTLLDQYEAEIGELRMRLRGIRGAAALRPVARDQAVIPISGGTTGGEQTAVPDQSGVMAYSWADPTGRFNLQDPDIAVSGNEKFTYSTKLRVTGYLLSDADGKVQARQVIAREQYVVDGKTELGPPIPLEQNIMEYVPEAQKSPTISDIFRPRALVIASTAGKLGVGVEIANLGHYLDYANVGVGLTLSTSGATVEQAVKNTDIGAVVTYWGLPPIVSTNIAVGVGVTTPAEAPGSQVGVTGNILFYLNN